MKRGVAGRVAGRRAAAAALFVLVTATACAEPARSPDPADASVVAARVGTGGLCPAGVCVDDLRVYDDGTWVFDGGSDRSSGGFLSGSEKDTVWRAVENTRIEDSPVFTDTCPTAYDGMEYEYVWVRDGQEHRVSTCEFVVNEADQLVVFLDNLAARAAKEADRAAR